MNLIDIMTDLAQPFAPQDIDFLPKSQFEKNGQTMCIGLPFADKRVYEDRLNQVCPGEWSSQMNVIVAGSKIIAVATVTICGVPHTDVGEANMGENSATESAAQAFKRACSQVGLGRFLYSLDKQYIPYDKQKKRFSLNAQEMLAVVKAMYRNAGLLSSVPAPTTSAKPVERVPEVAETAAPRDESGAATAQQITSMRKLYEHLGKTMPKRELTYDQAKVAIKKLSDAYREKQDAEAIPLDQLSQELSQKAVANV